MEGWPSYTVARRRITQVWVDAKVRNAVVLTGDVQRNRANDIKVDHKDPVPSVSAPFCTYTGDDTDSKSTLSGLGTDLKVYNNNRGYVKTKDALTADFRVLDYLTTPGSPVSTKASFAIRDHAGVTRSVEPADTIDG